MMKEKPKKLLSKKELLKEHAKRLAAYEGAGKVLRSLPPSGKN